MSTGNPPPLTLPEARELAARAHGAQLDRDGTHHFAHVARVAERVGPSEPQQRVAWLHDLLEDTDVDPDWLRDRLPRNEWEALRLLTHAEADSYEAYVERIACAEGEAGEIARAVKEADALDNISRCCAGRDAGVARYGAALARLWSV